MSWNMKQWDELMEVGWVKRKLESRDGHCLILLDTMLLKID